MFQRNKVFISSHRDWKWMLNQKSFDPNVFYSFVSFPVAAFFLFLSPYRVSHCKVYLYQMTQSYFWGHNWLFEQKLMCTKYFTVLKEKKAILKFISAYSIQFTLWHFAMDDPVPLDDGTLAFMGWASFHWDGLAF